MQIDLGRHFNVETSTLLNFRKLLVLKHPEEMINQCMGDILSPLGVPHPRQVIQKLFKPPMDLRVGATTKIGAVRSITQKVEIAEDNTDKRRVEVGPLSDGLQSNS